MITINNKEYRNIVEQVQHNKELIEQHYARDRVLAEVGIKVMGQKDDISALEGLLPPGGAEAWGEAYLVGTAEPYDIHIWTRPGIWFNIGPLNMMGDQGVPGDSIENAEVTSDNRLKITMDDGREIITNTFNTIKGDTGNTGPANAIVSATVNPDYTVTFTFKDGSYATTNKSLRGETGAPSTVPGPTGSAGKDGRSIYIKGIVSSISELNTLNPLDDLYGAYLVGTVTPYLVYIPIAEPASFVYAGQFLGGTVISVKGQTQDTWNADTKLDVMEPSTAYRLYGQSPNGGYWTPILRSQAQTTDTKYKYQPVMYDVDDKASVNNGLIRISENPTKSYHTASKAYVDNRTNLCHHSVSFHLNGYDFHLSLINTTPQSYGGLASIGNLYGPGTVIPCHATTQNYTDGGDIPVVICFEDQSQYYYISANGDYAYFDPGDVYITDIVYSI